MNHDTYDTRLKFFAPSKENFNHNYKTRLEHNESNYHAQESIIVHGFKSQI